MEGTISGRRVACFCKLWFATAVILSAPLLRMNDASAILPAHMLLKSDDDDNNNNMHRHVTGNGKESLLNRVRHKQRSRLSASDDLPVPPLKYPISRDKLPKEADTDPRVLSSILGKNFEPDFMAFVRPMESVRYPNGTYDYDIGRDGKLQFKPPSGFKSVAFSLPGRPSSRIQIKNRKSRLQLEKYLAAYTHCPVLYKWMDLGPRFWPRWLRQGNCRDGGGRDRSCSIPAGMSCKMHKSTGKTLLWWHCRNQKTTQCGWINIKYPVITNCKCSCN